MNTNFARNTQRPDDFSGYDRFTKNPCEKNRNISSLRKKGSILALTSPVAHLALSISNIAYRLFNVLTLRHFRASHEDSYLFAAKLLDTGKEIAIIAVQPFAFIALEIAAIIGVIFPARGLRLYFDIEKQVYGRPILSQIIDYDPFEADSKKTWEFYEDGSPQKEYDTTPSSGSESSTELLARKPPPQIPIRITKRTEMSFEKKLENIIHTENLNPMFSALRLANRCIEWLIDYTIQKYPGENLEEWVSQKVDLMKEKSQISPQHFEKEAIYRGIARKILDTAFKSSDLSIIQKFYKEDQTQKLFLEELGEALKNLDIDDLKNFKNTCLTAIDIIGLLSVTPVPNEFSMLKKRIVDEYASCFGRLFDPHFDQNLKNRIEHLQVIIQTIKNPEDVEGILDRLLTNRLNTVHVPLLMNYFSSSEVIKQAIVAYNTVASNLNPSIAEFITTVNQVLDTLPEKIEGNFYQQFFLVHVRSTIESMSLNMVDQFKNYPWDWSKKMDRRRRDQIHAVIERINTAFQLNIACIVESKTDHDRLISLLSAIFQNLDTRGISKWCEQHQESDDLNGFQTWLESEELNNSSGAIYDPQNIDSLFQIYQSQSH